MRAMRVIDTTESASVPGSSGESSHTGGDPSTSYRSTKGSSPERKDSHMSDVAVDYVAMSRLVLDSWMYQIIIDRWSISGATSIMEVSVLYLLIGRVGYIL
jgi:hypothetical protein